MFAELRTCQDVHNGAMAGCLSDVCENQGDVGCPSRLLHEAMIDRCLLIHDSGSQSMVSEGHGMGGVFMLLQYCRG